MSYNCPRVVEALSEGGVDVDAPAPGVMMAYDRLFGFTACCELLAHAGAQIDLRFAAGLGQLDRMAEFVTETGLTSYRAWLIHTCERPWNKGVQVCAPIARTMSCFARPFSTPVCTAALTQPTALSRGQARDTTPWRGTGGSLAPSAAGPGGQGGPPGGRG